MTRRPPRLPMPGRLQRSFLTPPEPGTTFPASGSCIMDCCNWAYSSSSRYDERIRSNVEDSMNVNMMELYAIGVWQGARYLVRPVERGAERRGERRACAMIPKKLRPAFARPFQPKLERGFLECTKHRIYSSLVARPLCSKPFQNVRIYTKRNRCFGRDGL